MTNALTLRGHARVRRSERLAGADVLAVRLAITEGSSGALGELGGIGGRRRDGRRARGRLRLARRRRTTDARRLATLRRDAGAPFARRRSARAHLARSSDWIDEACIVDGANVRRAARVRLCARRPRPGRRCRTPGARVATDGESEKGQRSDEHDAASSIDRSTDCRGSHELERSCDRAARPTLGYCVPPGVVAASELRRSCASRRWSFARSRAFWSEPRICGSRVFGMSSVSIVSSTMR